VNAQIRLALSVQEALRTGVAVVALESSVFAHGLPSPANREAAARMAKAVRDRGATPAVTAVVRGLATAGLTDEELERFLGAGGRGMAKVSSRDLAPALAAGRDGATTVAGAVAIAAMAGLSVVATGGIGGVHREPSFDESADLVELARSRVVVVCSGPKSVLDVRATAERLETLGVPVLGYRSHEMPAFFSSESGVDVPERVETPGEVAAVFRAQRALGRPQSVVVMQQPPASAALGRAEAERAVTEALDAARVAGVRGAGVTPVLLSAVDRATGGRSREVNLALLEANASLAAEIALAMREGR